VNGVDRPHERREVCQAPGGGRPRRRHRRRRGRR
jgi:hypothetical protein